MNHTFLHKKIYSKIREAKNILLVTHEKPDGDALGSVCAMIDLLESLGKVFTAYCASTPPLNFHYLPHVEKIISDKGRLEFADFDLILVYDCGDLGRTKLAEEITKREANQYLANIDHHPKVDDFANLEIKNGAASTTELVYDFYKANKLPINKEVANCILTGISSDTNNFLYHSTTDKVVAVSSEMLVRGANLPKIMEKTMRNKRLASLKLWGLAMSRLTINPRYNLAFTVLAYDEVKDAEDEDLEGISNYLGNLDNVIGVITLIEKEGGIIKGSIRTAHPTVDISLLARKLGGGGHAKASGFAVDGKLELVGGKWRIR